jgi:hypothetical protein
MLTVLVLLGMSFPGETGAHEKSNPLYQELRDKGVAVTESRRVPLPAPRMADGLDAAAQKAIIKELIGDDYDYDGFVDASVNAPYMLLPLKEIPGGNPDAPARALDLYFVAHGKFKSLTSKEVLDRLGGSDRKSDDRKELSADDLKKRGITIPAERAKREGYGNGSFTLLDKVELRLTGRSIWSETADSIILASAVDPAFAADKEYPTQWRSLEKQDDGQFKTGPPQPYQGAAYYVKVTRLKDPADGLFVECHLIFTEPTGWFNGTNLLRAKLPPVVQDLVRRLRKELVKASKEG